MRHTSKDHSPTYAAVIVFFLLLCAALLVFSSCAPVTEKGTKGEAGAAGPTGPIGPIGPQGPAGIDSTPITVVSFCGGPSVYPSNFPEYGLVISGRVYGVYSANGGFLALLPPGLYLSNAIGSACTFTINADGTVSR